MPQSELSLPSTILICFLKFSVESICRPRYLLVQVATVISSAEIIGRDADVVVLLKFMYTVFDLLSVSLFAQSHVLTAFMSLVKEDVTFC